MMWKDTNVSEGRATWRWMYYGLPKRWYPTTAVHEGTRSLRLQEHGPPERRYPTTSLYGVITCKTTAIFIAVKISTQRLVMRKGSLYVTINSLN